MIGDRKNDPVSLIFFLLGVAIVLILAFPGIVHATGTDIEQKVETTVKGSNSIGVGGADYDLASGTCRVHHGGFTVAIATFDEYCQGMGLIDRGMVDAGIRHICEQSPVGENYSTYQACDDELHKVLAPTVNVTPPDEPDKDDEDYRQQQQTYLAELESRMARVESARQTPRQIIQQPYLSDEKKAKLRAEIEQ